MKAFDKKTKKSLIFAALMGIAGGFINGFLGAGGGIILLFALGKLNPQKGDRAVRDNFAAVVAIVLLLSIVSAISYSRRESFDPSSLAILAVPGAIGGVLGAYLTDKLNTSVLKLVFSVIIVIAGMNMIL